MLAGQFSLSYLGTREFRIAGFGEALLGTISLADGSLLDKVHACKTRHGVGGDFRTLTGPSEIQQLASKGYPVHGLSQDKFLLQDNQPKA